MFKNNLRFKHAKNMKIPIAKPYLGREELNNVEDLKF